MNNISEEKNTMKPEEAKKLEFAKRRLIDSIKAFNLFLRHSVRKVYKAINDEYKDAKVFWFDFDKGEANELPTLGGDVCLIDDDTGISYYWIEYDYKNEKPKKKFAFFCKDIDTEHGNVHVIPGVFERFERSDNTGKKAFVSIDEDNLIKLERAPTSGCIPFSEPCSEENEGEKEWWVPIGEGDIIRSQIDHKQTIPTFAEVSADFANNEEEIRDLLHGYLKDYCENIELEAGEAGLFPKYDIVVWNKFKDESHQCCASFFNMQYFKGYGFLTRYNCVDLDLDNHNKRIPYKSIIKTYYKTFSKNSNLDSTSDSTSDSTKKFLSEIHADKFKERIKEWLSQQPKNHSGEPNGETK